MKLTRTIKKILTISACLIVGAGMTVLLVAANGRKQLALCKDLVITIRGEGENFYIDKNDIASILKKESSGKLVRRAVEEINLARLEQKLEKNSWIRDAELYFDSRNVLHVIVFEREPIARVFTKNGASFYIDSSGMRMPLLDRVSVRVPVVTNFTNSKKLSASDSLVLNDVKAITRFVVNDDFWNAQVAQIDVVGDRYFDIIPTVGNHIIRVGNGENIEQKLGRLMVFYQQVTPKLGIDKYSLLDVQFEGQVVAVHKGKSSAVDSLQLQKNIQELMLKSQLQAEENLPMDIKEDKPGALKPNATADNIPAKTQTDPIPTKTTTTKDPDPLKKASPSNPVKTEAEKKREESRKPKAVMPKRTT